MHAVRSADEDRLPWLEPYREAARPRAVAARTGRRRPALLVGAPILLLAVGGAGYWLGRQGDSESAPRPAATIALPAPAPAPSAAPASDLPPPAAEPQSVAPAPAPDAVETDKAEPKPAAAKPSPPRKAARPKVRAKAKARAASSRHTARPWPKMPSPGPAGQVIQLGAFSTPDRAYVAYRERIARYPLLARMPRVVVPVVTKPGNRVLYVLRLGTVSRQQSRIVCANLRASGDHCLVIG